MTLIQRHDVKARGPKPWNGEPWPGRITRGLRAGARVGFFLALSAALAFRFPKSGAPWIDARIAASIGGLFVGAIVGGVGLEFGSVVVRDVWGAMLLGSLCVVPVVLGFVLGGAHWWPVTANWRLAGGFLALCFLMGSMWGALFWHDRER